MLTNELMNRQLQRYRDLTALGYRFKAHHDYWNAKLAFESSILSIYPLYRANGDHDRRPFDMKNVRLNQRNLSKIHLSYKLKTIFDDKSHWHNTCSNRQILDGYLKIKPTLMKSLMTYYSVSYQNMLLNINIKLRKKYGYFGLIALSDYYLERRHGLVHREANKWITNDGRLGNKLNQNKAKSRQ